MARDNLLELQQRLVRVNERLMARAQDYGQYSLAEDLHRVQAGLERITPALEALEAEPRTDAER